MERAAYFTDVIRYGEYLQRMHAFYRRFELGAGKRGAAWLSSWRIPHRLEWLSADLTALNVAPLTQSRTEAPREPAIGTSTALLGGLYVVIGATLGASVLLKRTAGLGLPDGARSYLTNVACERTWPVFLATLETEAIESEAALTAGAMSTFECILEHLAPVPVP